jgi:hypothetical protein
MPAAAAPLHRALEFARARRGAIMSVGIDPRRIRPGRVMVLAARPAPLAREFKDGNVPDCLGTVRVPPPLGGPVVCHTADGKTVQPAQAAGNSGTSGVSGAAGHPGVFCQARLADPGASGDSGSSGTTGHG